MHTESKRGLAKDLRSLGYSYSYISDKTGLSKSTLSDWLTNISYVPNTETIERLGKARAAATYKKAQQKELSREAVHKEACADIGEITERDIFMFGIGLYLGEGSKTRDEVRIANSDPKVINIAIAWFLGLGLTREHFLITLHLYPDSDIQECLQFWSTTTNIPISQFGKVQIDNRKNKSNNKAGKLPYGTAQIAVRSLGKKEFGVILARKIKAWIDIAAEQIIKRN